VAKKAKKSGPADLTGRNERYLKSELAKLRRRLIRQTLRLDELKEVVDAQGVLLSGLTKASP